MRCSEEEIERQREHALGQLKYHLREGVVALGASLTTWADGFAPEHHVEAGEIYHMVSQLIVESEARASVTQDEQVEGLNTFVLVLTPLAEVLIHAVEANDQDAYRAGVVELKSWVDRGCPLTDD